MRVKSNKDTDLVMLRDFDGESFLDSRLQVEGTRKEQWRESYFFLAMFRVLTEMSLPT